MKINLVVEINQNNASEVEAVQTCTQDYNLAKAYLPIISSKAEMKEMLDAIEECKPYCQTNVQNGNGKIIYTFAYNDEMASTPNAAVNVASLAAELLGS